MTSQTEPTTASVVIVDGELQEAQRLARLVHKLMGRDIGDIECTADLPAAIGRLQGRTRAVLLLDAGHASGDALQPLRQALVQPCPVVILSVSVARAMDAFELGAADFIPKPVSEDRLAAALRRALECMGKPRTPSLAVTLAGKLELIPLDSIVAIHGDDDYSSLETLDGRRHLHRKTLAALMQVLPPNFRRVHRSHIVNLDHVERVLTQAAGRHTVVLKNGAAVPASRSHMEKLEGLLTS